MAERRRSTRVRPEPVPVQEVPVLALDESEFEYEEYDYPEPAKEPEPELLSKRQRKKSYKQALKEANRDTGKKGDVSVFKIFAMQAVVNIILGIVGSLRSIIIISIFGSLLFFAYFMYHSDMNVELSLEGMQSFWLLSWEYAVMGWDWAMSKLPF